MLLNAQTGQIGPSTHISDNPTNQDLNAVHPLLSTRLSISTYPSQENRGNCYTRNVMIGWLMAALVTSFGLTWWWHRSAKKQLGGTEGLELLPKGLNPLASDAQHNSAPQTLRYSEQEFQEMVSKTLDELPEEFDKEWENVAVVVSTESVTDADKKRMGVPESHLVFGTYSGIDRTKGLRSQSSSRHVITIYQPALELRCGSDKERLEREIRRVVLHELAHHLGMSHSWMKELGL